MKRRAFWAACLTAPVLCAGGGSTAQAVSLLARCGPGHFVADRQGPPAAVQAYFLKRSYAPGQAARLVVARAPQGTTMQVFHADVQHSSRRTDAMTGVSVSGPVPVARGSVTVPLARPFLNRGVPPRLSDFPYWMWEYGKHADFLADDDLDGFGSGATLAGLFKLIVFAGHEGDVTAPMFDLVTRYRDLGGNLAFLSSNSFFYRVVRRGNAIRCLGRFRDEGRPEAALIGVQYLDWNHNRFRNKPYVIVGAQHAPWFFAGTGLRNGNRFGYAYGVEIDARAPASPRGTAILAELPDIFGRGRTAQMTYYVGKSGA